MFERKACERESLTSSLLSTSGERQEQRGQVDGSRGAAHRRN